MRKNSFYSYLALFIVHAVIAAVAFNAYWHHPHGVLFSEWGDGLKNTFTLTTYVKAPITADGILKYNTFQYPFGDYVYYTDNTPLFSIPFRWICHHVVDLSAHTIAALYLVVILNIIFCGLLIYYILRRLVGDSRIAFIMAVILPWCNMQILRIWVGHNAFSFSSLIMLGIILMMQWDKHRQNFRKQVGVVVLMCLLSFFSFLAQGYYLAIMTAFLSGMLFFYGLYYRRERVGRWSIVASMLLAASTVCLTLTVLQFTDPYLALRPKMATGYDWMEAKVRFTGLFSHYNLHSLFFPIASGVVYDESEVSAYLGNVGLYAFFIFGIVMLLNADFRSFMIDKQKQFFGDPLKGAMFLGAVLLLSISFGEHYYTSEPHDQSLHFVNVLNPFFYIHQFTRQVEQFRSLERFVWPFFYVFNIWMIFNIVAVSGRYGKTVNRLILTGILFFGGWELSDYVRAMNYKTKYDNSLSPASIDNNLHPQHLKYDRYQAILPIPYYSLGPEDYDYIICDNDGWSKYNYRLAIKSGLPIMASKMSRTPLVYNLMLMNFVAYDSMASLLREKLNDKPILVAVNKELLTNFTGINVPGKGTNGYKIYMAALSFTSRNHLAPIDSADGVMYYEWYPPAKK